MTLGPNTGRVLVDARDRRKAGEYLDDSLTISQRLLELPHPFEDMGNKILRTALSAIGARSHDGLATCAVLAAAILDRAEVMLAAGYDARHLSDELALAAATVLDELRRRAEPIAGTDAIETVLRSALVNPALATTIAEIVDTVGPDGSVKVEASRLPETAWEYVQGGRWTAKAASPYLFGPLETVVTAHSPAILVSASPLTSIERIMPALEFAAASASRNLVLIASRHTDEIISTLLMNKERGVLNIALALTLPSSVHFGDQIVEDIGLLVGAAPEHLHTFGDDAPILAGHLGTAVEVWASRSVFGIVGGAGEAAALAGRVRDLQAQLASEGNSTRQRQLRERIGTLQGMSALVRVPNRTAAHGEDRVRKTETAVAIAHHALREGVVPGGGAALAHCAGLLEQRGSISAGAQVLSEALRAPMTTLARNAGREPAPILASLADRCWHETFDVVAGAWVDSRETGPVDGLVSTVTTLDTAVSVARMVISTDTLLSHAATRHTSDATSP
jgi:chaperonin GroEL